MGQLGNFRLHLVINNRIHWYKFAGSHVKGLETRLELKILFVFWPILFTAESA